MIVFHFHQVEDRFDAGFPTSFDGVVREMGNLLQRRVTIPHRLYNHLTQFHRTKRIQPSFTAHHIDTGTKQIQDLGQHNGLVGSKVRGEGETREVRLQQHECFEMWTCVIRLRELDRNTIRDSTENDIFVLTDGEVFIFGR